jgi:ribosome-binding ATPase YchF (GTP1/OBG family)
MKISFTGLDLPEGKVKYNDPMLIELEKKFSPKKVSPFFAEFSKDNWDKAESIAIHSDNILDLLIVDIEKLENRLERAEDEKEKGFIKRCLTQLEKSLPLCDLVLTEEENALMKLLSPISSKPTLVTDEKSPDVNSLIKGVLDKANYTFFYTAGKPEVHAWLVRKGSDIVTCAGKIHTDLAKGFIKADIVNFNDFKDVFNMQEAKTKGLVKLVDRDYIIQEGDIIEIRFNV